MPLGYRLVLEVEPDNFLLQPGTVSITKHFIKEKKEVVVDDQIMVS